MSTGLEVSQVRREIWKGPLFRTAEGHLPRGLHLALKAWPVAIVPAEDAPGTILDRE